MEQVGQSHRASEPEWPERLNEWGRPVRASRLTMLAGAALRPNRNAPNQEKSVSGASRPRVKVDPCLASGSIVVQGMRVGFFALFPVRVLGVLAAVKLLSAEL
jgi:hypothetical protein